MRRLATASAAGLAIAATLGGGTAAAHRTAAAAAAPQPKQTFGGWNPSEQLMVVEWGVIPRLPDGRFHGDRLLTRSQFRDAAAKSADLLGVDPVAPGATGPITIAEVDSWAVKVLGLGPTAKVVQDALAKADLRPGPRAGTEVIARWLGLRFNHPFPSGEHLEPFPSSQVTRAEAAWTFAQALSVGNKGVQGAWKTYSTFSLPKIPANRVKALRIAVGKIGMPYIWGGVADTAAASGGAQVRGGYDCSGFSWRVFKLSGLRLGRQIGGRTADQQAGEIAKSRRVPRAKVRAGDLLFFGTARFGSRSTYSTVSHMGIALSDRWSIESTGLFAGVGIRAIDGRSRSGSFAWARRLR